MDLPIKDGNPRTNHQPMSYFFGRITSARRTRHCLVCTLLVAKAAAFRGVHETVVFFCFFHLEGLMVFEREKWRMKLPEIDTIYGKPWGFFSKMIR